MSYQLQFGSLADELKKAGLNGDAAVRIAKILANSAQPMRSGQVEVDSTPAGMRNITPGRRKFQLTNLDFRDADPDYRRTRTASSEARPRPVQPSAVQGSVAPQQTDRPFGVSAGSYTEARSEGDGVSVGLRVSGTGPFLTQDPSSGALLGKSVRAEADAGASGLVRFFVEEQAGEYVFRLQVDTDALLEFVSESLGLDPTSSPGGEFPTPTPASQAFVDVQLNANGLCFRRASGAEVCVGVVACDQQG